MTSLNVQDVIQQRTLDAIRTMNILNRRYYNAKSAAICNSYMKVAAVDNIPHLVLCSIKRWSAEHQDGCHSSLSRVQLLVCDLLYLECFYNRKHRMLSEYAQPPVL